MKIAISAVSPSLDAEVEPRFGRCQYFVIVDPQTMEFEGLDNPNIAAVGGAGIGTAQMIANKGAEVILTGNCGPNAYQTLTAAGVQVITGVTGGIKDAIEAYKAGRFQPDAQPSVAAHFGAGATSGMGMGRGMGMGKGMGMGMGMGMGVTPMPASQAMSLEQEMEMLKTQAQTLGQQLSEIQSRLEEMEKGK